MSEPVSIEVQIDLSRKLKLAKKQNQRDQQRIAELEAQIERVKECADKAIMFKGDTWFIMNTLRQISNGCPEEEEARECVWVEQKDIVEDMWFPACEGSCWWNGNDMQLMTYCPHCKGRIRIK